MQPVRHSNRLVHETSPYLLQHAHNPVDWYPWGPEALERARREDKPILLSIGYSACHWCHVMEHESFEDAAVAQVMNEHFICIKVDREERPDLDKIYQLAHQILAQRPGGWPLNMFLTPGEHMPFFGGTYFPKTPKYGMHGFTEILTRVAEAYRAQREAIDNQSAAIRDVFRRITPTGPAPGARADAALIAQAVTELKGQFDRRYGGFGGAPKFPHPTSLEFLLRQYAHSVSQDKPDREFLTMVTDTLTAMAHGGIYDQLGGGFCRYSVDERWEIPHFEKMLYDNALLLPLYADCAHVTHDTDYRRIVEETGQWVLREMQAPEGGYYSALDADSEGHEGKFYVWATEELRVALTPAEWQVVEHYYGIRGEPNFEGKWNLNVRSTAAAVAKALGQTTTTVEAHLASARAKLLALRAQRVRPGRDDKVLTSWNALMIRGMAHAGCVLDLPAFVDSATRTFDFVRATLWRDGRLLVTTKNGKAHLNAYLDDYVFLIDAGLELLQARWRSDDLAFIQQLADVLLEHFEDESHGGFFFTADDHETLVHRVKPTMDEAIPSGNGIAAQALARLGHLSGNLNYLHAAERTLEALASGVREHPSAYGSLLIALEEFLHAPQLIVLRGEGAALAPWLSRARARYAPRRYVVAIPNEAPGLTGLLAERQALGPVTAYVCAGHSCQAPVTDFAEFEALLADSEIAASALH
jgi:hypothetical protein